MSIDKITCGCSIAIPTVDEEERMIMRRLYYVYGIAPTGNKSIDKEKLRQCEIKQLEEKKVVLKKHITISVEEQEKFIEREKDDVEKKEVENFQNRSEETEKIGAKTKGEQVYLVIQMKKHFEEVIKEKRKEEQEEYNKKQPLQRRSVS